MFFTQQRIAVARPMVLSQALPGGGFQHPWFLIFVETRLGSAAGALQDISAVRRVSWGRLLRQLFLDATHTSDTHCLAENPIPDW